jgi:AraC-like DNA-binding protein
MSVLIHDGGPDVLSGVLVALRLRGRLLCRSELSAPWSIEFPAGDFAHYHLVERGACVMRVGQEEIALGAGDLVVLPHGRGHVLSDERRRRSTAFDKVLPRRHWGSRSLIRHGGGGTEAHLLCGAFEFDGARDHPVLAQLPDVLRIPREAASAAWLRSTLELLQIEARQREPGTDLLLAHLLGVIFVHLIRAWASEREATSWLTAIRDQQIGDALRLVHGSPERAWSLASLARQVGMSRSTFAERFATLVGEPPLSYLERWRLDLAAHLLRTEMMALDALAARVGYASAASLSRAFKRRFREAPGAYRRRAIRTPGQFPRTTG